MTETNWTETIQKLIEQLKDSDVEKRQEAAYNLHRYAEDKIPETKSAVPTLQEALKDDDWAVRKMSIMALGELNVTSAIPTMIDFLQNDLEPEVRVGAAQALGFMKARQATMHLVKALDDSYSMLQSVAIYSLGLIGDQATAAVPKLIEFLQKPEFTDIVQVNNMAALALGEIGDKTAIEPLVKALNDAAYHERKFTIAYSLALLEGSDGVGYTELKRMKDNYELIDHELESFEQLQERIKKGELS